MCRSGTPSQPQDAHVWLRSLSLCSGTRAHLLPAWGVTSGPHRLVPCSPVTRPPLRSALCREMRSSGRETCPVQFECQQDEEGNPKPGLHQLCSP